MSRLIPVTNPGIYYITFTCCRWIPLIRMTNAYQFVYKWFGVMQSLGHTVLGYVIMPNHIHLLLHYSCSAKSLNTLIGNGKRFLAYEIVSRLKANKESRIIRLLETKVSHSEKNKGKKHEIWIKSFDVKHCYGERFLLQKLNYIHANPISGKWKLSADPQSYLHSSASFYFNGIQPPFPVKDYREFLVEVDEHSKNTENPMSPSE